MRYLYILMTNWPRTPVLKTVPAVAVPYIKPITLVVHWVYPPLAVSIMIVDAAFAVEIAESG